MNYLGISLDFIIQNEALFAQNPATIDEMLDWYVLEFGWLTRIRIDFKGPSVRFGAR